MTRWDIEGRVVWFVVGAAVMFFIMLFALTGKSKTDPRAYSYTYCINTGSGTPQQCVDAAYRLYPENPK